jgi:hypothetical protein
MCVRGQDLTIPDFIRYSERFGPVTPHPSNRPPPRAPKITMLGINKFRRRGQIARRDLPPRRRGLAHRRAPTTRRRSRRRSSTPGGAEPRRQHDVRRTPTPPTTRCRSASRAGSTASSAPFPMAGGAARRGS